MRWIEVVEVVAVAVVVPAVVVGAGRAEWAAPKLLVLVAPAFAPVVGIASRTWWASLVIRRSVRSAVRRWCVNSETTRNGARRPGRRAPFCCACP